MCVKSHSESGQPCGFEPCDGYLKLWCELEAKDAENARLRRALAPVLAHADAGSKAPPIKFSVGECGRIKAGLENRGE